MSLLFTSISSPQTVIFSILYPSSGWTLSVVEEFSSERITIFPSSLFAPLIFPPSESDTIIAFSFFVCVPSSSVTAIANGLNESHVTIKPYGVTTHGISSTPVTSPALFVIKWYALNVTPASSGP